MIALNNLAIGYGKPLFKPLNIRFEENTVYGILGKSGCGKSTLLKTIAGMHRPLGGNVEQDDEEQIYMMHQKYTNFGWLDCLNNVLIAERVKSRRRELESAAKEVLNQVGLSEYLNRYPAELSGGMQQRLSLARMLFVKPKYLLMDEPLSALDDATRSTMQQLIIDAHQKTKNTIIMVTHSPDEAKKMCDRILKLD